MHGLASAFHICNSGMSAGWRLLHSASYEQVKLDKAQKKRIKIKKKKEDWIGKEVLLINPGHLVECTPIPTSQDKEQSNLRHHRTKLFFRDQALSLWSGSTDSKILAYQKTNPRGYHIVRTHTKETTGIQDLASPNHQ